MDYNDRYYMDKLVNKITNNTDIKTIDYVNYYDNYYIVIDDNYLYLLDDKYSEILKEDRILLYENSNNYDIIYKDGKFMYFTSILKDNKLIYRYYNLYDYELLDEVLVGGTDD